MTQWKWQVAIIVPKSSLASAEDKAAVVAGSQQSATFVVPLSATGQKPATHFACCTRATDEWLVRMRDVLANVPGAAFYRMDSSGTLAASTSTAPVGSPWSFDASVSDCGLQRIEGE